jgi:hypothetical protein
MVILLPFVFIRSSLRYVIYQEILIAIDAAYPRGWSFG